ncbi:DUF7657 domain-containing protein [Tellurirhabdus rosea]|uniref:DUF7657 domain-containing protein n=1 Tax=Tellurirhabdus rosea TaxID=2674997 RepID=UPI0022569F5B|nr:hypothetical protein [Tellurirhabdus rosea]
MSKKKRVVPGPSAGKPTVKPEPVMQAATVAPAERTVALSAGRSFELIRFDTRLKWFLAVCVGLFVLFTLAKIHSVSIPAWNQIIPDGSDPKRGLLSGTPRSIRMDDYAVGTPWILSQVNKGLPLENETLGGEKAPILVAPTKHFSVAFRPEYWGFLFLPTEQGYAWVYNFRACLSIIGALLALLLLTRNNFWLSATGSLWLFLSSGTQSWTYIPTSLIASTSLIFVATVYVLFSTRTRPLLISALLLIWSLGYFALILYPPYQVPLAYVLAALLLGYLLNNIRQPELKTSLPLKAGALVLAVGAVAVVFLSYYADVKTTIEATMNTVYPGKRNELGGTGFIANWFSEYFSWQWSDSRFPKNWLNSCELAHYLTFAPIILPGLAVAFVRSRSVDWVLLLLGLFILVGYVWIEVGFPGWLAKATLWNMSPTRRTQIPFGIANVLLTVLYLHYLQTKSLKSGTAVTALSIAGVVAYFIYAAQVNIGDSDGFFRWHQLVVPVLFFAALGSLLLISWRPAYRQALFCGGIILFLLPNLKMNPVAKGLAPITDHQLYKSIQSLHQQEPKARWVVFGSQYISYLATATGVDLLSGVKFIPARTILKVLDPQMKRDSAYNRYAHTVYNTYIDGQKDTVIIQNTFEDGYQVLMDPCSPRFRQLNVKYIIFDRQPQPIETRCMKLVNSLGTIQIYRIND